MDILKMPFIRNLIIIVAVAFTVIGLLSASL